jgi:hypothetical protein
VLVLCNPNAGAKTWRWGIFRKSGHRFSEENAIKSIRLERFPIQRNRETL